MRIWTLRLGLSLMVLVGLWTSRVPAQDRIQLVPVIQYEPARPTPSALGLLERPQPPLATHPLHRALNKHGIGCGMDSHYSMCGNLHYEARFAFASCRWFFDVQCPPNESGRDKNCRR